MATSALAPAGLVSDPVANRFEAAGDERLAQLVANADEAAFGALYERYHQALYRYCRSIVRDDADAQDALQSAWTRALVALRRHQRDAPVRPWLYRIAHNESVSLLRRRDQRRDVPEVGAEIVASAEEQVIDLERFEDMIVDIKELPD